VSADNGGESGNGKKKYHHSFLPKQHQKSNLESRPPPHDLRPTPNKIQHQQQQKKQLKTAKEYQPVFTI
jgi:hypothetical protein